MGNQGMLGSQGNLGNNSTGKGSTALVLIDGVCDLTVYSFMHIRVVELHRDVLAAICEVRNPTESLSVAMGSRSSKMARSSFNCCFEVSEHQSSCLDLLHFHPSYWSEHEHM